MAVATHGHASGWRASDLRGGKDDLRVALGPAHLEELDGALSTLRRSAEAFERRSLIPKVIGAIDGSHIKVGTRVCFRGE